LSANGLKEIKRQDLTVRVPDIAGWPNQGVGRINPDGSKGSCTACHPRHSFSLEIARKPYTCKQCHFGPDVPAYNIYAESKHGNIFFSQNADWNFTSVPWVLGTDFRVPTCSACHNALLVDENGNIISERTHRFDERIWVRLFGIYSHPQPVNGTTYKIVNEDGQPLPTTLMGKPAEKYLISEDEQKERQEKMKKICTQCHNTDWVTSQFEMLDRSVKDTDRIVLEATKLMNEAWGRRIANNSNPFDEHLERLWVNQWLFYGSSTRLGNAMIGADYMAFDDGWYDLTANLYRMKEVIDSEEKVREVSGITVTTGCQSTPGFEVTGMIAAMLIASTAVLRKKYR
jgi:cytochrome c553